MAFETKEQVLEKILSQEKPRCPDCKKEMNLWEVPPITCGDGLGWDSPYLYVCFNDTCPIYVSGWDNLMENYAHRASYRCIKSPFGNNFEVMPVFSSVGGSGQIIDDQVMAEQEVLKEAIKKVPLRTGEPVVMDVFRPRDNRNIYINFRMKKWDLRGR